MRIGYGYDTHRLVENRQLVLGGVTLEFDKGLLGHSDADVLCHAIGDALLGAAALGDLGAHFPDTDPAWKDADSLDLLRHIAKILAEAGFAIGNIDSVVILELPKLAPHVVQMRQNIANALSIDVGLVSVKATRNEGMDSIGRGEGITAQAVALIMQKSGV
jgi:2-C-methyl-D-erythritol 2,4-cyclodiphosphate synthase